MIWVLIFQNLGNTGKKFPGMAGAVRLINQIVPKQVWIIFCSFGAGSVQFQRLRTGALGLESLPKGGTKAEAGFAVKEHIQIAPFLLKGGVVLRQQAAFADAQHISKNTLSPSTRQCPSLSRQTSFFL